VQWGDRRISGLHCGVVGQRRSYLATEEIGFWGEEAIAFIQANVQDRESCQIELG
jgi:hypothetical protein